MPRTWCYRYLMGLPLACSYICVYVCGFEHELHSYIRTHIRTRVAHVYMRYTYDLPESALRSTSEYITAAFVALIPIADERMRVSGAPPDYFCAVGTSPKWSSRIGFSTCDRCQQQLSLENCHFEWRYKGRFISLWHMDFDSMPRRTPQAYKQSLLFTL